MPLRISLLPPWSNSSTGTCWERLTNTHINLRNRQTDNISIHVYVHRTNNYFTDNKYTNVNFSATQLCPNLISVSIQLLAYFEKCNLREYHVLYSLLGVHLCIPLCPRSSTSQLTAPPSNCISDCRIHRLSLANTRSAHHTRQRSRYFRQDIVSSIAP